MKFAPFCVKEALICAENIAILLECITLAVGKAASTFQYLIMLHDICILDSVTVQRVATISKDLS